MLDVVGVMCLDTVILTDVGESGATHGWLLLLLFAGLPLLLLLVLKVRGRGLLVLIRVDVMSGGAWGVVLVELLKETPVRLRRWGWWLVLHVRVVVLWMYTLLCCVWVENVGDVDDLLEVRSGYDECVG